VLRAARLMRDHHVGSLVVVDETAAGRLVVGLLTDRDVVTSAVAMEVDPATLVVEYVMSHDVVTPAGALLGLVTLDDLLSLMAGQLCEMALAIEAEQRRELKARP